MPSCKTSAPRILMAAAAAALLATLTGCASYQVAKDIPVARISAQKLEWAHTISDTFVRNAVLSEKVSRAAGPLCSRRGQRLPFELTVNPETNDDELRAALKAVAGWDAQPMVVALTPEAEPYQGKYVAKVNGSVIKAGDVAGAYDRALTAVQAAPVSLEFTDGSTWLAAGAAGCTGKVIPWVAVEQTVPAPVNNGDGYEFLPRSWYLAAAGDDEWTFLVGRSLYFTAHDGRNRLTAGLLIGAVGNGIARLVTFGLSPLVGDVKNVGIRAARKAHLSEADLFGLQAVEAAGMDVNKAMAFADRMSADTALPVDSEVHFSAERVAALRTEGARLKAAWAPERAAARDLALNTAPAELLLVVGDTTASAQPAPRSASALNWGMLAPPVGAVPGVLSSGLEGISGVQLVLDGIKAISGSGVPAMATPK